MSRGITAPEVLVHDPDFFVMPVLYTPSLWFAHLFLTCGWLRYSERVFSVVVLVRERVITSMHSVRLPFFFLFLFAFGTIISRLHEELLV